VFSESTDSYQAMVLVRVPGSRLVPFDQFLRAERAVVATWHLVGDIDLLVQVDCRDLAELDRVVSAMRYRGGAVETVTHLVVGGRGR
jgi:DNA-binding Lrp family transcriptional regulator